MDSDDPSADETSPDRPTCRICLDSNKYDCSLIKPCDCRGSVALVHPSCLEKWVQTSKNPVCQMCQTAYEQDSVAFKNFSEWTWPRPHPEMENSKKYCIAVLVWMIYLFVLMIGLLTLGFSVLMEWIAAHYVIIYGIILFESILGYCEAVLNLSIKWYLENNFYQFKDKSTNEERTVLDRLEGEYWNCRFCPMGIQMASRLIKPCRCAPVHQKCMERCCGTNVFRGSCAKCKEQIEQEMAGLTNISEWKFPRPMSSSLDDILSYGYTILKTIYILRFLNIWMTLGAGEILTTMASDAFWIYWMVFPLFSFSFGLDALLIALNWCNENIKYTFKDRVIAPEKIEKKPKKCPKRAGRRR